MKVQKAQKKSSKAAKKGVYNKYSFDARKQLIRMVEDDGKTLASSAKELGFCQTTARLVYSTWKQEGRIFEKKIEHEKRLKRQAKKRVSELKRMTLELKKLKIKQGDEQQKDPNDPASQILQEISQKQQVQSVVPEVQRAENNQAEVQHNLQSEVAVPVIYNGGFYYICTWPYSFDQFGHQ